MSYSDVTGHRSMVFDGVRNSAYTRALARVIRPGTTVMDLGAGTGILGLNAAKLGASEVHLVEPTPALEVARQLAAANRLDNLHYHQCRVEELSLETQVDIIVSVFTGNFLLSEDLLPSLFHARDRFLAPGGHMIPDLARMEVAPVNAPHYYQKHIDSWAAYPEWAAGRQLPALELGSLRSYAVNKLYYDSRDKFEATALAGPAALMELDLRAASRANCDSETRVRVSRGGCCHGWLGWFQMRLGDQWLSTSGEHESTHWSQVFLPLETPLELEPGDELSFALRRPEFGDWTWTTRHGEQQQRHSTFLSQPVTRERLLKSSDSYQPALDERGSAAHWLLGRMAGGATVGQLAEQVFAQYPNLFTSPAEALAFTRDLAGRFT